jgi:uncharacterized membrane protein YphA (DoxX/SURF4 family)
MHTAILAAAALALNGDVAAEAGGDGTLLGVVSAISIVGGYLLLFALWRWVFSARAKARRGEGRD